MQSRELGRDVKDSEQSSVSGRQGGEAHRGVGEAAFWRNASEMWPEFAPASFK